MVFDEHVKELHESQNECYVCGTKFNENECVPDTAVFFRVSY